MCFTIMYYMTYDVLFHDNPIQLRQCNENLTSVKSDVQELQRLQWQVTEGDRRVQEKRSGLEEVLQGHTDAQLQGLIVNFESSVVTRQKELQHLQQQVDGLNEAIAEERRQTTALIAKRGQAELLRSQADQLQQEQRGLCSNLQRKYPTLPLPIISSSSSSASSSAGTSQRECSQTTATTLNQLTSEVIIYNY